MTAVVNAEIQVSDWVRLRLYLQAAAGLLPQVVHTANLVSMGIYLADENEEEITYEQFMIDEPKYLLRVVLQ